MVKENQSAFSVRKRVDNLASSLWMYWEDQQRVQYSLGNSRYYDVYLVVLGAWRTIRP